MTSGRDTVSAGDGPSVRGAWSKSAVLLIGVVGAYSLVVIGLCGTGIWGARVASLRMAESQAAAIAAFSAAYTSRMYDLSDEVTRHLAADLRTTPLTPEAVAPMLAEAAEATAQNDYYVVFAPDGTLVASSTPMRRFRIQDDALTAHRGGAARFIGQVVRGRATGEVIYRLSRRIDDENGRMVGIVGAAIRPFGIRRVAQRGPKDPQVTVWTEGGQFVAAAYVDFRPDGSALAPPKPDGLGALVPGQVKTEQGTIRSEAKVEGLPLWISTDFERRGVLATWRAMAIGLTVLGGFLLLMGWAFAWLGLRASARDAATRAHLAAANAEAEGALRDREMLLREIHHRVRNSLMLVSSFLMLHARGADAKTRAALELIQARVTSIGMVHETLYAGSHLGSVSISEYLGRLLPELSASLGAGERGIVLDCEAGDVAVPGDQASTLGLIVSEAVTNAVKYAFGDGGGRVLVTAQVLSDGLMELCVQDDGKGTSGDGKVGLGSQLLTALAGQLGGRVTVTGGSGTLVRVTFPAPVV